MNASTRISVRSISVRVISKVLFCTLLFAGRAAGQADQGPAQLGGIDMHPGDSVRGASASNVYVSVREPNGLPVTESATVRLSCPLAGVNLSGPTKDTALAQFSNIPAGDCVIEVNAPGYKPAHERALDFTCEGLGQWRGKAAWLMYFRQKPNQRSYLRLWETQRQTVEIPLKGRVWVAATTYQVSHIETDLRDPMKDLELAKDHLAIDYGPVDFQNGKTELWLPWYADMYLELHHHRYHHRQTLSNYPIFGVDTKNTISKPKGAEEPDVPPQNP